MIFKQRVPPTQQHGPKIGKKSEDNDSENRAAKSKAVPSVYDGEHSCARVEYVLEYHTAAAIGGFDKS